MDYDPGPVTRTGGGGGGRNLPLPGEVDMVVDRDDLNIGEYR